MANKGLLKVFNLVILVNKNFPEVEKKVALLIAVIYEDGLIPRLYLLSIFVKQTIDFFSRYLKCKFLSRFKRNFTLDLAVCSLVCSGWKRRLLVRLEGDCL